MRPFIASDADGELVEVIGFQPNELHRVVAIILRKDRRMGSVPVHELRVVTQSVDIAIGFLDWADVE